METYDYNFLQNNGFTFSLDRIPQTTFRVVACDIPSITVPPADAGYPGTTQYFPGTFNEFDTLTLDFLVDEHLKNYEELYRWITQQRFANKDFRPKSEIEEKMVSDGVLVTMTNASNPNRIFYFKDLFPISLGGIHFDTSVDSPAPVTCTVSFRYSYFEMR
jgi:hypothetical protein